MQKPPAFWAAAMSHTEACEYLELLLRATNPVRAALLERDERDRLVELARRFRPVQLDA